VFGYFEWGAAGDLPKMGDWDGDGRGDVTVYRPSSGGWFIRYSSHGCAAVATAITQDAVGVAETVAVFPGRVEDISVIVGMLLMEPEGDQADPGAPFP